MPTRIIKEQKSLNFYHGGKSKFGILYLTFVREYPYRLFNFVSRGYEGSVHDSVIYVRELKPLLDNDNISNEKIVTDTGFIGLDKRIMHPTKGRTNDENIKRYNRKIRSFQKPVEHFNKQIKNFKILKHYRGLNLKLHNDYFFIVCTLTNIQIKLNNNYFNCSLP